MNAYTADKTTPLTTHLLNALLRTKAFAKDVFQWFNATNACQIIPTTEEILFGVISDSYDGRITKKLNYTTLFMRHYLYSSKLNNKAVSLQEFTTQLKK